MCEFHESTCNGFGDIWWTDNPIYFSSIDIALKMCTSPKTNRPTRIQRTPNRALYVGLYIASTSYMAESSASGHSCETHHNLHKSHNISFVYKSLHDTNVMSSIFGGQTTPSILVV